MKLHWFIIYSSGLRGLRGCRLRRHPNYFLCQRDSRSLASLRAQELRAGQTLGKSHRKAGRVDGGLECTPGRHRCAEAVAGPRWPVHLPLNP